MFQKDDFTSEMCQEQAARWCLTMTCFCLNTITESSSFQTEIENEKSRCAESRQPQWLGAREHFESGKLNKRNTCLTTYIELLDMVIKPWINCVVLRVPLGLCFVPHVPCNTGMAFREISRSVHHQYMVS